MLYLINWVVQALLAAYRLSTVRLKCHGDPIQVFQPLPFYVIVLVLTILLAVLDPDRGNVYNNVAYVDLGYSRYSGSVLTAGINQFLGIRYAASPIGNLRWRAPADPLQTSRIQNARKFGPTCLGIYSSHPSIVESEDCLYINVWAPTTATPASKLPVWFYIQGGGYIANSNANYNGSKVVEESGGNIVFVNFNYRTSAWGFLASDKIRANGDLNAGLLDQRKALEWVQKYISLFGGDPEHVVLHGTSAGAGSLALHLTAYGGRDDKLFAGGIGQSVFFPTQPLVSELEWQFEFFLEGTRCSRVADELACLRSLDSGTLQRQNKPTAYPNATSSPAFYFSPAVDGDLIQDYPYRLFEDGKFIHVPIIFGDDTDEGTLFVTNAENPRAVADFMVNQYPQLTHVDTDAINAQYPLMTLRPLHAAYYPSLAAAYGESTFTCPAIHILQAYSQYFNSSKTWSYRVNIRETGNIESGYGVPHTFELPAIFGPGYGGSSDTSFETYNAPMVPIIMNYWISFIRTLSPNQYRYGKTPYWEAYSDKQRRIVLETGATAMEDVPSDQLARCQFWKSLAVTMEV